jgi:arsenate reductase
MAEGWLRALAGERFEALSAGTHPVGLNPGAERSMAAAGIDIAGQTSDSIQSFLTAPPELVVTVCDNASRSCPSFPGATRVVHWPFPDPADASGSADEIAHAFDSVRDAIRARIETWLAPHASGRS